MVSREADVPRAALTRRVPLWVQEVQTSYEGNPLFLTIIQAKTLDATAYPDYSYEKGILRRQGRVCVGSHGGIREKIIKALHDSALGGHSGVNGTYQRIKPIFYWPTLKGDVHSWVRECEVCQRSKHENVPYPGLLQLFTYSQPSMVLHLMDFVEGLPPSEEELSFLNHHSEVDELIQERVKVLQLLKENLQQAQQRMKSYADKKRTEREFEVGDEVFLKLQPYKQTSIALRKQLKLSAKYFGPYKFLERIGKVAYRLELPPGLKIHPVFHVSLLKKKIGSKYFPSLNLPDIEDEVFKVYPAAILARRLIPRINVGVPQQPFDEQDKSWPSDEDRNQIGGELKQLMGNGAVLNGAKSRNAFSLEIAILDCGRAIKDESLSRSIEGIGDLGISYVNCLDDVLSKGIGIEFSGEPLGDGDMIGSKSLDKGDTWRHGS
ncbi:UNVERIFIED_CONTAM: hypothetical protein Sradi_5257000 [Sesamum radiatum]|uniref:Integrase zinc-binding domain-containing protein n=1 Tax=Sesamum radiatum TaxID=300843 RepID=A0AAW2LLE5_SESRA